MHATARYVISIKPITSHSEYSVSMYMVRNRTAVHFDSYGYHKVYTKILHEIDLLDKNDTKHLMVVCGEYCAVFLSHLYHFKDIRRFLGMFNCDLLENNCQILEFGKKLYHLNLPLFISKL